MSEKKLKVCFILTNAYPVFNSACKATFGGAEVQLYQTANELANDGNFEVSFVVGDFGQKDVEQYGSVKVIKSYSKTVRLIKYLTGIYYNLLLLKKLSQIDADVYIQMCAGHETGLVASLSKFKKKKFIYMCASSKDVDGGYRKKFPLLGMFYEFGLKRASCVIAQNDEDRLTLEKRYGIGSVSIKNPFRLPTEDELSGQRDFVLWVGRGVALKQPEVFLRLAQAVPEEKFVMIMPKQDLKLWEEIKAKADNIHNLTFIEKVPFEKINGYFRKAKLFINSSRYEGFPNTFIQSAMFAVPIVSLNVNPDSFLTEWNCGYCAEGDEEKMFRQVKKLLEDKDDWQEKSKRARTYAEENHDISKNVEKIKKIITDIVR